MRDIRLGSSNVFGVKQGEHDRLRFYRVMAGPLYQHSAAKDLLVGAR
jgi:hypothetical protein